MSKRIFILLDEEMAMLDNGQPRVLTSRRREKYIETLRSLEEQHHWKTSGQGAQFMQQHNPYEGVAERVQCRVTALGGMDGQLLYALTTPEMGGLYLKDPLNDDAAEGYRFGERGFAITDMATHGERIACAVDAPRGERHLVLMASSAGYRWITQGDTLDAAPSFSPDGRFIYYASTGLARDEEGRILAHGPSAVLRLDPATGDLTELCDSPTTDYLCPMEGPGGDLYMIVRPYKQDGPTVTLGQRAKNWGAFFKGLGKVIRSIGDPRSAATSRPAASGSGATQARILNGQRVEIAQTGDAPEDAGCIPENWVLMRRDAAGKLHEVQRGVADYAFDGDDLIYTDGRRVFRCRDGRREKLCKGTFIPRVWAVDIHE